MLLCPNALVVLVLLSQVDEDVALDQAVKFCQIQLATSAQRQVKHFNSACSSAIFLLPQQFLSPLRRSSYCSLHLYRKLIVHSFCPSFFSSCFDDLRFHSKQPSTSALFREHCFNGKRKYPQIIITT